MSSRKSGICHVWLKRLSLTGLTPWPLTPNCTMKQRKLNFNILQLISYLLLKQYLQNHINQWNLQPRLSLFLCLFATHTHCRECYYASALFGQCGEFEEPLLFGVTGYKGFAVTYKWLQWFCIVGKTKLIYCLYIFTLLYTYSNKIHL